MYIKYFEQSQTNKSLQYFDDFFCVKSHISKMLEAFINLNLLSSNQFPYKTQTIFEGI